jgi:hypothetical protein
MASSEIRLVATALHGMLFFAHRLSLMRVTTLRGVKRADGLTWYL